MALSSVVKAAVLKSTLGHLSQSGGSKSTLTIRDRAAAKLGITGSSDLLSALSAVQQGRRVWTAGGELDTATPDQPHDRNLPLDYSLNDQNGRYGYRVIVDVTDPSTLSAYSMERIVYSNVPVSPDQIKDAATRDVRANLIVVDTDPRRRPDVRGATVTATIVSAGRTS